MVANDFLQHWLHSVGENTADDLVIAVQEGDGPEVSNDSLVFVLFGDQNDYAFPLLAGEGA